MASVWNLSTGQRLQQFADQACDYGIIILDPEGRIVEWSAGAEHLTGWAVKEAEGQSIAIIFTPEDRAAGAVDEELETARRTGKAPDVRWHLRKDGSRFFVDGFTSAIRDSNGKLIGFGKILRDITQRQELADASERHASLLDLSYDAVFIWDFESDTVLYWNQGAQKLYGFTKAEATGNRIHMFLHTVFPEGLELVKNCLKQNGRWQGTLIHTLKDQSRLHVESRMLLRTDLGSRPIVLETNRDIEPWKKAEEALRQSKERLSLILETSSEGICGIGADYTCTFINTAGATMLGYRPEELLGRQTHAVLHHHRPDGSEYPLEECRLIQAVTSGTPIRVEDEVFWHKDGRPIPVSYSVSPMPAGQGRPSGGVITFTDITERRRAEQQLQETAERLSVATEAAGLGIWVWDITTDRSTWENDRLYEMFGVAKSAGPIDVSQFIAETLHPDDLPSYRRAITSFIEAGSRFHYEGRFYRRSDKELRWLEFIGLLHRTPDGKPLRAIGTTKDITERKRAEEKLRASEDRYRTLFNSMDEGFCIIEVMFDAAGTPIDLRFLEVNPAFEKITGITDAAGRTASDIEPDTEQRWLDLYGRVATTGASVHHIGECSPRHRWFNVYATRIGGPESRKVAILFSDITERRHTEEALRASEERFRLLTELSPDGVLVDIDDIVVYANQSAARILGAQDAKSIVGRSCLELVDPQFHKTIKRTQALAIQQDKKPPLTEMRWVRLDGSPIHVQTAAAGVTWEGQPAVQLLIRDITELKQAQNRLRILSERVKLVIEEAGEGIWDWDVRENRFALAGGMKTILGGSEEELRGSEADWVKLIHPDDVERVLRTFHASLEEKTPMYLCEYRIKDRNENWKWVRARGAIVERDQDGKPLMMTGTMVDITAQKESDEMAWRHANLDTLTDLPNRRLFRERLDFELRKARRSNRRLALLFIDLDGFKQVNDLHGHEAGDLLLMEVAHRIRSCVRETDTVSRLGGDEFTVILSELTDLDHVEFVCHKVLTSLSEPFHLGKEIAYISGSIGVSLYPLDATVAEDMMRKADQAMYAAKRAGKNQFNYFTREMDEKAHMRLHIANELRHALKERQMTVYYQPVVDLKHGHIAKAEALVRWLHPHLGNVKPSDFIPMAEESGMIRQIGNWVFQEAATCSKRCSEQANIAFQISVNKSPIQFMSRDSDTSWLKYLSTQGMPGSSISIEITEGVLLHASAKVTDTLNEYTNAGIQVALDDFGTGYASMSYLQKFHIDYVKIDQSFVRNITSDPDSRAIAETIIIMAHKLGKKVIAEGIETREQMEYLVAAGCDYGQGYLFSHPLPEEELIRIVRNRAGMQANLLQ